MKNMLSVILLVVLSSIRTAAAGLPEKKADPYLGAIVVDAATGEVLFEDRADTEAYPASVLKLMDLLIVLEKVDEGLIELDEPVTVTAEAAKMGGSQVYLKEGEVFTVEDLLYALMVQSGNDAAVALAIHIAGTKDGFAELMNGKAASLGMKATTFHSVHGLPPGQGQQPDVTTARDLAALCRDLVKRTDALRYASTREKGFRNDTFIMRNHNPLLASFEGCDGLKTGFYTKAGYSMAVTAERKGDRVIAVILGSVDRKVRNEKGAELMAKGFLEIAKRRAEKK